MNVRSDDPVVRQLPIDECQIRVIDVERVKAVRASLPSSELVDELAGGIFTVLADASRLRLVLALLEAGELCVCDAAATTNMTESATSHSLRVLRLHGVVKTRRAGRMSYYSLTDGHIRILLDVALEHARHG